MMAHYMQEFDKHKIFWRSRRGMLELDLLLVPFTNEVLETLSPKDQVLYEELLEQDDQDLLSWLMGRENPANIGFKCLIEKILKYNNRSDLAFFLRKFTRTADKIGV